MYEYFKITAANKDDYDQLLWLFRNKRFFPEFSSTPALPPEPSGTFDYRELVRMVANNFNDLSVNVRTRKRYSLVEFGVNVIPTAEWTGRYKLASTPNIAALNMDFDPSQLKTTSNAFQSYVYANYKEPLPGLMLTFTSIASTPVADPTNVGQWNTFFDLPTFGTPFNRSIVSGNTVTLLGGANITVKTLLFQSNVNITKVEDFGSSVVATGVSAFRLCSGLTTVNMPSLVTIGNTTFQSCTFLVSLNVPAAVTVGTFAFQACQRITSITMPSMTTAGASAFANCNLLTSVDFPELLVMPNRLLYTCSSLTYVKFGKALDFGAGSGTNTPFYQSPNVTHLTMSAVVNFPLLPGNMTLLQYVDFPKCTAFVNGDLSNKTQLATIKMPKLVVATEYCFSNCLATDIDISSCTTIESYAFSGAGLTRVDPANFPAVTGTLGDGVFSGCPNLVTVNMPTITSMGQGVFASSSVAHVTMPLITELTDQFGNCINLIDIHFSSCTTVGNDTFLDCASLSTVDMPVCTTIGSAAFKNCTSLTALALPECENVGNETFMNCGLDNTFVLPKLKTTGIATFMGNLNITALSPSQFPIIEHIGESCFENLTGLVTINLPTVITSDSASFRGCTSLTTAIMSSIIIIPVSMFDSCTSLVILNFASCTTVSNRSFGDAGLTSVTSTQFPSLTTIIGPTTDHNDQDSGAFKGCINLTNIYLPLLTTVGNRAFAKCTALTTVSHSQFPAITTVGYASFVQCSNITSVSLANVTSIGFESFYYNTNLVTVSMPSLTVASDYSFAGCKIGNITLGSLTTLGVQCFLGNPLTTFSFPLLTTLGVQCFANCTQLTSVTSANLPSLTSTANSAFQGCSGMTTVNLPTVTLIPLFTFRECNSLTTINISGCTNLGGGVNNNNVFLNITGKTITLTVKAALMTNNGGNPDGDIQYLQANNTVTVVQV